MYFIFKLLKLVGKFFSLSISNMATLDFKLAKSIFLANFDAWAPVAFFNAVFVAELINLTQLSVFLLKILVLENINSIILCLYQSSY